MANIRMPLKLILVVFLLIPLFVILSCDAFQELGFVNREEGPTECEETGEPVLDCPFDCSILGDNADLCPFEQIEDGQYFMCLESETDEDGGCACIDAEESTPNGFYDAGTIITAKVRLPCTETRFNGWYDSDTGELVSGEKEYVFTLNKHTYLHVESVFSNY